MLGLTGGAESLSQPWLSSSSQAWIDVPVSRASWGERTTAIVLVTLGDTGVECKMEFSRVSIRQCLCSHPNVTSSMWWHWVMLEQTSPAALAALGLSPATLPIGIILCDCLGLLKPAPSSSFSDK